MWLYCDLESFSIRRVFCSFCVWFTQQLPSLYNSFFHNEQERLKVIEQTMWSNSINACLYEYFIQKSIVLIYRHAIFTRTTHKTVQAYEIASSTKIMESEAWDALEWTEKNFGRIANGTSFHMFSVYQKIFLEGEETNQWHETFGLLRHLNDERVQVRFAHSCICMLVKL